MIETFDIAGLKGRHEVALEVTVAGCALTVRAGSFAVGGEAYDLLDDHTCELVSDPAGWTAVSIYLVRAREGGAVAVLVDAAVGGEEAYVLSPDGPHEELHLLVVARIPPGAVSWDEAAVRVRRIIKKEV